LANWPTAAPLDKEPGVMVIDVESKAVKATDEARYEFLDKQYKN
jgi:para-nitrobenzyl esterase